MGLIRKDDADRTPRQIKKLVEKAEGETVTKRKLRSAKSGFWIFGDRLFNEPPISYLDSDEQIHHLYWNCGEGLRINETSNIEPEATRCSAIVFTDERIITVIGQREGDRVFRIPYGSVHKFYIRPNDCDLRLKSPEGVYAIRLRTGSDKSKRLDPKEIEILTEFLSHHTDSNASFSERWRSLVMRRRRARSFSKTVRGVGVDFHLLNDALQFLNPDEKPLFKLHTWYISTERLENHKTQAENSVYDYKTRMLDDGFSENTLITDERILIDCRDRVLTIEGYKESENESFEPLLTEQIQSNIPLSSLNNPSRVTLEGERIEIHPLERTPIYLWTHQTDIADAAVQRVKKRVQS